MDVIKINIKKMGTNIADSTPKLLKQNTKFRQFFIPELIDNPHDKTKSIRAKIVSQRKNPSEQWENFSELKQTDLKSGEWLSLDIDSNSLDIIIAYCNELKRIYAEEGKGNVFNTKRTIILGKNEDKEDVEKLISLINENPNAKEILEKISEKDISPEDIAKILNKGKEKIEEILSKINDDSSNDLYNKLNIKFIKTDYLKENLTNDNEEFWQRLIEDNPKIISNVIPSVLTLICSKPYVGGKALNNKGGNYSDFVYNCGPNNVSLIEIKTPCTQLLKNTVYRANVYAPSEELTGAIVQLRKQKDNFIKEYYANKVHSEEQGITLELYDPKCYLIIGNNEGLSPQQQSSFELFRKELKDIEIITFTELIKKLELIIDSLSN